MTCPSCRSQVWATYTCDDGKYRCWQCKATGKGRIVVHKTTAQELREAGLVPEKQKRKADK